MNRIQKASMRRVLSGVLALLLLPLLTQTAAAAPVNSVRTCTVSMQGTGMVLQQMPDEAMFWEYPVVQAGMTRYNGVIRLINNTGNLMDFTLKSVRLPYDNAEALAYLNALMLTVSRGTEILYRGPYTRVMDTQGGMQVRCEAVPAGGMAELSVSLQCAFTYEGDPAAVTEQLPWEFAAAVSERVESPQAPQTPVAATVLVCVAGGLVLACAVVGTLGLTKRRRRK